MAADDLVLQKAVELGKQIRDAMFGEKVARAQVENRQHLCHHYTVDNCEACEREGLHTRGKMCSRSSLCSCAILIVICTVILALVPSVAGTLAAQGGLITALRAWQWAAATLAGIALAASLVAPLRLPPTAVVDPVCKSESLYSEAALESSVLRC